MREHKTFLGKTIGVAFDAFKGIFVRAYDAADHDLFGAIITVTNVVKNALNSSVANLLVNLTKTDVDNQVLKIANDWLAKILADELMLKGLTNASTPEEVQATFEKVFETFGTLTPEKKEKFYTSIAAELLMIAEEIKSGKKITFGEAAKDVEIAYQAWLASK